MLDEVKMEMGPIYKIGGEGGSCHGSFFHYSMKGEPSHPIPIRMV